MESEVKIIVDMIMSATELILWNLWLGFIILFLTIFLCRKKCLYRKPDFDKAHKELKKLERSLKK